ncbi:Helicase-like transcription factor CHR28 [Linum grandiflorum]
MMASDGMQLQGSGGAGGGGGGDLVPADFDLDDISIDLDMMIEILEEPSPQSQQEDAQSLAENGLQGGSMADLGNQMIQLPASGEASPSAYETDSRGVVYEPWMDNSGFGLVCDGAMVENGNGVPVYENGTEQSMDMALGGGSAPLQISYPSTSPVSHNSDLSSDLDGFYSAGEDFPRYDVSGEFDSEKFPGDGSITVDDMIDEMGIFSTDNFEGSSVKGFLSEDHGVKHEPHAKFKFGSYVYDGVHEEMSMRPCSSMKSETSVRPPSSGLLEPRFGWKPPVSVHPQQSSFIAPAIISRSSKIKAEKDRGYSRVAPSSSELPAVSYPTNTSHMNFINNSRHMNSNIQNQHFSSVQRYRKFNNYLHRHDGIISQKTFGSPFSRVSPESTHSNSSGSRSVVDDDPDICILEDISQPPRLSQFQPFQMPTIPVTPAPASSTVSHSDPHHYTAAGGKHKICDERVLFRAALQDLNQPKAEANPPDGLMAIPLMRHQRIALSWMTQKETSGINCLGGILADDQGLGKTISTIALILTERAPCRGVNVKVVKKEECETLDLDEEDEDADFKEIRKESGDCEVIPNNQNASKGANARGISKGRPAAGTLIVCPTSVLRQWAEELHKKVTAKADLSVMVYHGSSRTKDPHELAQYDVVLTTYSIVSMEVPKKPFADEGDEETEGGPSGKKRKYHSAFGKKGGKKKDTDRELFETLARPLAKVAWFRVVLDEAQSIKNHKTQVARACWGLRAKRRWCLSGTPLQNAIDDLYSYFRFLRYDPYTVYTSFCNGIKGPIQRNPVKGYRKLQAVLKTVMLRRTKGTLLDGEPIINLPPKTIELKRVEFSEEERCFYSRLESDSRAQFKEYAAAGTVRQNYVNILLMLLRLRQACDHPLLVRGYESVALGKSSTELAMTLPHEKRLSLLNCLEASLAICGLCNDPPEDAVVSVCGHVFCNQCILEHLNGDDNQCPTPLCKTRLNASSVFSKSILESSRPDQSIVEFSPSGAFAEVKSEVKTEVKVEVNSRPEVGSQYDSSKIKAALSVLESLSKPKPECEPNSVSHHDTLPQDSSRKVVGGEKAIVFSQWTRMLDLLEACLKTSSIQYRRLDGTMSVTAREKAVKDFNTLPEVTVIIMSLKAASLGLNMVAACHVILLDLWWNPTTEDQAIDRAHRIGQTRPVTVLRLTVKDTVEDRILALQQKKRQMVSSAFGEDGDGSQQTRLTEEDLKYLFMG